MLYKMELVCVLEVLRELNGERTVIIAVNVHGVIGTGHFADTLLGQDYWVDPYFFWHGIPEKNLRKGLKNPWKGFRDLVTKYTNGGKPIILVFAQCFGLRFLFLFVIYRFIYESTGLQYAQYFRYVAKDAPKNLIVHGLSYGSTYSANIQMNVLREAMHLELTEFVQTIGFRESLLSK